MAKKDRPERTDTQGIATDADKRERIPASAFASEGRGGTFTVPLGDDTSPKIVDAQSEYAFTTPNVAGTNSDLDELALKRVVGHLDGFSDFHSRLWQAYVRAERLWGCRPGPRGYQGRANLFVPMAYRCVEVLIPRIYEAIMPRRKFFDGLPGGEYEAKQAQHVVELLLTQFENNKFPVLLAQWLRDLYIRGNAYFKTGWRFEKRTAYQKTLIEEKVIDPNTNAPSGVRYEIGPVKAVERVVDDLDISIVDPLDIVADPRIFEVGDSDIAQRIIVDVNHLTQCAERGIYRNVDKAIAESNEAAPPDTLRQWVEGFYRGEKAPAAPKEFTLYEFWGRFDIDGDGQLDQCVITVCNRRHVLRIQRNPYFDQEKPFFVGRFTPRTNRFYSMGMIEPFERSFYELNDKRNQMMDATTLTLTPMWLMSTRAQIPNRELVVRPFKVVRGVDISDQAIRPFVFPDVTTTGYKAEETLRRDLEEGTGASNLFMGNQLPPSDTPVGVVNALITEASARTRQVALVQEQLVFLPMLTHCHNLNQQFVTRERVIRIQGQKGFEFKRILPEDIIGNYSFKPIGVKHMNDRYLLAGQWQVFIQTIATIAAAYPDRIDLPKAVQKWAELGFGLEEVEDVFPTDDVQESQNSMEENWLWLKGQPIHVEMTDDHNAHIDRSNFESHTSFVNGRLAQKQSPQVLEVMYKHINDHYAAMQKIQEKQQELMQQMELAQQAQMSQGVMPGMGGGPPKRQGIGSLPKTPQAPAPIIR